MKLQLATLLFWNHLKSQCLVHVFLNKIDPDITKAFHFSSLDLCIPRCTMFMCLALEFLRKSERDGD